MKEMDNYVISRLMDKKYVNRKIVGRKNGDYLTMDWINVKYIKGRKVVKDYIPKHRLNELRHYKHLDGFRVIAG